MVCKCIVNCKIPVLFDTVPTTTTQDIESTICTI